MMQPVWIAAGGLALTLGVVGVFLPLLPTVPFLLLSAFCFGRGSSRLHRWLLQHRVFGPPIEDWIESGQSAEAPRSSQQSLFLQLSAFLCLWASAVNS